MATRKKDAKPEKVTREKLRQAVGIFRFIAPYKWAFILGMIMLTASSLVFMIIPGAGGELANTAVGKSRFSFSLSQYAGIFVVILVVQAIFSYVRTITMAWVSEKGMADVRKSLYERIITQEAAFFDTRRVGELTSRLTSDIEKLQTAFSVTLAEFFRQIITLIVGVIIIAILTPRLSLIMLATFPIVVVLAMVFGRYIRKFSRRRQDELASTNVIVDETLQTFQVVKAFSNELFEARRYGNAIDKVVKISLQYARVRGLFFVFIITILFGAIMFILWQGALLVQNGEMEVGDLFSFILYTGIIGGSIGGLGNLYSELAGAVGSSERVMEILNSSAEVNLETNLPPLPRFEGNIRFDNVSFHYPTRKEVEVLKGVSFAIEPGQKIALVGHSGAGKSTIIQLLMQFYKPIGGEIRVDGRPATDYDLRQYRSHMALVPQEVLLFGGTIRENIAYGKPDASDAEIEQAAQQANALDFIRSFPEGLDTIIGERGIKLSGGQRQRVAIARALLKDPAILLLDEATSSLDAESERLVQEALDRLMEGRTSIIIAHRLATIRNVDTIFVLDNGKVVEQGNHEALMAQNGIYNALARLQFSMEEA